MFSHLRQASAHTIKLVQMQEVNPLGDWSPLNYTYINSSIFQNMYGSSWTRRKNGALPNLVMKINIEDTCAVIRKLILQHGTNQTILSVNVQYPYANKYCYSPVPHNWSLGSHFQMSQYWRKS